MLQISHYTKQYSADGPKAVDDLSLHIRPGEIYGFLGHNGAGKTTTIKACCGLLDFTEGEILVNGMSIKKQPLECKKIMSYIPDNPDLYEFMSDPLPELRGRRVRRSHRRAGKAHRGVCQ